MSVFVNGIGCISPQKTWDNSFFLDEITEYTGSRLTFSEPVYKNYINPVQLRRINTLLKAGTASAIICVRDSGIEKPDAIITGTGLGCVEDTENFLLPILENNESLMTPTAFIQSTHNAVNSLAAILLKCNGYNFTYVHRGFSFESALLDSIMQIENGNFKNVLTGGFDELTERHHLIFHRLNLWKKEDIGNLSLLDSETPGTIGGQGASFFMLSNEKNERTYCRLNDVSAFFRPEDDNETKSRIETFLAKNELLPSDIDLLVLGFSGDPDGDKIYHTVNKNIFPNCNTAYFKHLCGEYMTASAFAMWYGAKVIAAGNVPEVTRINFAKSSDLKNLLIYNHYDKNHHSLILLSKC